MMIVGILYDITSEQSYNIKFYIRRCVQYYHV